MMTSAPWCAFARQRLGWLRQGARAVVVTIDILGLEFAPTTPRSCRRAMGTAWLVAMLPIAALAALVDAVGMWLRFRVPGAPW